MATFNPGTGGSLVSTSLEKAFFEAALQLQLKEAALAEDPNNVTLTADLDGLTVSTDITIPVTTSNTLTSKSRKKTKQTGQLYRVRKT